MVPTKKAKKSKIPYVLGKICLFIKCMTTDGKNTETFQWRQGREDNKQVEIQVKKEI